MLLIVSTIPGFSRTQHLVEAESHTMLQKKKYALIFLLSFVMCFLIVFTDEMFPLHLTIPIRFKLPVLKVVCQS